MELLKRPEVTYDMLAIADKNRPQLPDSVKEQVEISAKYDGYIKRQLKQVEQFKKMEKKKIATMACHHSIRFNRSLTMQEMNEVVRQLNDCENPYHCPHGRPTILSMSKSEIEKKFHRIV